MTGTKQVRISRPLSNAENEWAEQIRSARSIGLFLDFDGTLSPIVESPTLAKIDPDIQTLIGRLAERDDVSVIIVSGRALADVRARAAVDGVIYAGNHGLEIESDTVCFREPRAESLRLELRHVVMQLELAISDTAGIEIEHKGLSASVHYRRVNADLHEWVRQTVCDVVSKSRSFVCLDGKMVVEVRPRIDWHKGHAVTWILDSVLPSQTLPLYVGDDISDEDAFAVIPNGIAVHVGEPSHTCAAYWVPDLSAVRDFLSNLLQLRPNAEKGL
jgi:trehalose-phosphatase